MQSLLYKYITNAIQVHTWLLTILAEKQFKTVAIGKSLNIVGTEQFVIDD